MGILDRLVVREHRAAPKDTSTHELARRVSSVPDAELVLWIDNTLAHVGYYARRISSGSDDVAATEAQSGSEALGVLVDELVRRRIQPTR